MQTNEDLERRIIALESLVIEQDRLMDDLNDEILRLNAITEKVILRLETQETREGEASAIRPLSEEVPPPHW
ncbi:MAG: SlyX family protein [Kiritimatiellia bacterium]